jgi:hypothetical protein
MGTKHKKTRKEKILADYRHQVYILKNNVISPINSINNSTLPSGINEKSYLNTHILKDVIKTGVLTCSIIAAEVIFYFLLQKHIFALPIIKY